MTLHVDGPEEGDPQSPIPLSAWEAFARAGQGGLRQVQGPGGGAHGALARNGVELPELLQLHAPPPRIILSPAHAAYVVLLAYARAGGSVVLPANISIIGCCCLLLLRRAMPLSAQTFH